jgi:hypothetical protein
MAEGKTSEIECVMCSARMYLVNSFLKKNKVKPISLKYCSGVLVIHYIPSDKKYTLLSDDITD